MIDFSHTVIAGAHDTSIVEPSQQRRVADPKNIKTHQQYNHQTLQNDIALIFTTPFTLNQFVKKVNFATSDLSYAGQTATVVSFRKQANNFLGLNSKFLYQAGWGELFFNGPTPSRLQQVSQKIIKNSECGPLWYFPTIQPTNICMRTFGRDACRGDRYDLPGYFYRISIK